MNCQVTSAQPGAAWLPGVAVLLSLAAGCGAPEPVTKQPAPASPPDPVKVTQFYATPGIVYAGENVTVCYGAENAESVRIEPRIRDIRPSRNRCFSFAPGRTGVFKFIATGSSGEASAELAIKVVSREEPKDTTSLIPFFVASMEKVPAGMPVTLCFSLEGADNVSLDPPILELEVASRCFIVRPPKTTTFTLTATGGGQTQQKSLTITVD